MTEDLLNANWAMRAAEAERSVVTRHLRSIGPAAALGVVGWPSRPGERLFFRWHYWWQAHLLDCLVDAYVRSPSAVGGDRIRAVARGIWLRNGFRWTNSYYDDMAWLGLALKRAVVVGVLHDLRPAKRLTTQLLSAVSAAGGDRLPWNKSEAYFNVPANGPAAILLTRMGLLRPAKRIADWMQEDLRDPLTSLVFDGVHFSSEAGAVRQDAGTPRELNTDFYTYCQGVVLGAELELWKIDLASFRLDRMMSLTKAISSQLGVDGVLIGHGGGNGGLFSGIAIRYLAAVAREVNAAAPELAAAATHLVFASAERLWSQSRESIDGRIFGSDWSVPAGSVSRRGAGRKRADGAESSVEPERDLSVQLGAWMALEAAAMLAGSGPNPAQFAL